MIRDKIFRLNRHKSSSSYASSVATDASAQKFDFTFTNIRATQVPKGWDKIYVSLISVESGKPISKSSKVTVKNGTCQWTETFPESIWISDIDMEEECLFKFLLATGASKSSVLGETQLNLAAFLSSESSVLVSLPLKKCNYETILHVEVKCLTPKTNLRDEKWKCMNTPREESADHDSIEVQSETSDCTTAKSVESRSSNNVSTSSRPTDASTGEMRYSFDSMEDFGRQDSIESNESLSYSSYSSSNGSVRSVRSLQSHGRNQREEFRKSCHAAATLLQPNLSSSKVLKDGGDATAQELEAEAKMWEQNARKLTIDMERLRDELCDQNLSMTKVNVELAASRLECQDLTQEIEHLKSLLEGFKMRQNAAQDLEFQEIGQESIQKEMEEEIRFQKVENENLSIQLNKTQESNIELISILQEMEETIEKQKIEIESLSIRKLDVDDSDLEVSAADIELQHEISILEGAFQDKTVEIEIEEDVKSRILREFVVDCKHILAEKEQKIMILEAALKVCGLEADCNELTEENLDLLYELNELRMDVSDSSELGQHKLCFEQPMEEGEKTEILQEELADYEDMESIGKDGMFISDYSSKSVNEAMLISGSVGSRVFRDEIRAMEPDNNQNELMKLLCDLQEENVYLLQRVYGLEAQLRYLTDESESSRLKLQNSESQAMILENQIKILEEENESQKVGADKKLSEMQKKWLEAEEARLGIGEVNIRLQSTTESLMEEYNSIQNFNVELREQKMQLQRLCMDLESKATTFQDCCCKYAEDMGNLRGNLSLLKGEISAGGNANAQNFEEDEGKLMIMFQGVMECESKLKSIINDLDSKLELSESERLRLAEENSLLHMKVEKVYQLQREVLDLRVLVQEMRSHNQQLEASFMSVLKDYEEVTCEKVSMVERMSSLQRVVSKEEECRPKNNALQEKILRLEGDLIAKDAVCVQDAEMKNELNRMKIVNSQLLVKIKHLENEREDLQRRMKEDSSELNVKQTRRYEVCSKCQVQICHQCHEDGLEKGDDAYKSLLESAKKSREAESKISVLEAELQEIRDRYFEMSLNYAEVADQREQLVMKLKALNV